MPYLFPHTSSIEEGDIRPSELNEEAGVELAAGEVVGDGVLLVGDVGHPEVGGDVVQPEDVEAVAAEPYVAQVLAEATGAVAVLIVEEAVAHADVGTTVSGGTEDHALQT